MYRIRFHGRGGQGMKTTANIVGTAFFNEGFEVQDAPRYGAERRGAPMSAYVRAARTAIQERGLIADPGLIVVADESLLSSPAAGVLLGAAAHTLMLIITTQTAQLWKERLQFPGAVVTLRPTEAVSLRGDVPVQSAACAGATARLAGVIGRETLAQAVRDELDRHLESLIERNMLCALAAYDAVTEHAGLMREATDPDGANVTMPDWIDMPHDVTSVAAPGIRAIASSEQSLTGAWRTFRPIIDYDHCNRCSWICGTLCPDSAISIGADRTPQIDYDHCKGCLVCVSVCPPHAIRAVPERDAVEREEAAP